MHLLLEWTYSYRAKPFLTSASVIAISIATCSELIAPEPFTQIRVFFYKEARSISDVFDVKRRRLAMMDRHVTRHRGMMVYAFHIHRSNREIITHERRPVHNRLYIQDDMPVTSKTKHSTIMISKSRRMTPIHFEAYLCWWSLPVYSANARTHVRMDPLMHTCIPVQVYMRAHI